MFVHRMDISQIELTGGVFGHLERGDHKEFEDNERDFPEEKIKEVF